jgi:hypothetical protein
VRRVGIAVYAKLKLRVLDVLQWHDVHVKFNGNTSRSSGADTSGHADGGP